MDQDYFDIDYEGNLILTDARIEGNLKSDKSICLNGMIQGNVHSAKLVIVNKNAVIDGDVECDELYLNGKITGCVCVARKTVMGDSAEIKGGLCTTCLEIAPGAKIGRGLKLNNASK
ncbi:MAG: polymer-forming cytoskeletal protein [Odoribacter sp.]